MGKAIALALSSILLSPCAAADPIAVSIQRDAVPQGATGTAITSYFYSVPVSVGSTTLLALLDTGSIGLRVLPHQLSPHDTCQKRDEHHEQETFGSGIVLDGISAKTDLALAGHSLGSPSSSGCHAPRVPASLQLIRFGSCATTAGDCPLRHEKFSEFRFGGNGQADFGDPAILGIRGRQQPNPTSEVYNPLKETGHSQYIVDLPRRDSEPGRLLVDPNQMQARGFTTLVRAAAIDPKAPSATVFGCIAYATGNGPRFCGPMLFDTGATGVSIKPMNPGTTSGCQTVRPFKQGSTLAIRFMTKWGVTLASETFTAGSQPAADVKASSCANTENANISLGLLPFLAFSVLIDAQQDTIAVQTRPNPLPNGPFGKTGG